MRIVLGVGGGIAAYKAILLLRLLTEAGHTVRVVPTAASLNFVGRATWEAISGQRATSEVFEDVEHVAHVRIGQDADLVIVAPATADLLARAATGRADDLLTSTLLTARCPILFAPAMHTEMWEHPATQANVATLRNRGNHILDPASGRLTGTDTGPGRLPDPGVIRDAALALLPQQAEHEREHNANNSYLAGLTVTISAGGTIEPLDPVRFLGNRSSGRQGIALAAAAARRGATVELIAANVHAPIPDGITVTRVETAHELQSVMTDRAATSDVVVMTAAVADFRPEAIAHAKIKKTPGAGPDPIRLIENPDILAGLTRNRTRPNQVIVGFAAETGDADGDVLTHGKAKAARKGADLLVINDVSDGKGFGTDDNEITIVTASGDVVAEAAGTKDEVADAICNRIAELISTSPAN